MVRKFLLLFIVLWTVSFSNVQASSSVSMGQLDTISGEALEFTEMKRYEEAEHMLLIFSENYLGASEENKLFNMDDLRIITVAHSEALDTLKDNNKTNMEKINSVTKFRLVIDAVQLNQQPLWVALEDPIMTAFEGTQEAVISGDSEEFNTQLNQLLTEYAIIYPSLKVSIPAAQLQQLDTRMEYVDQYRPVIFYEETSKMELEALQEDLQSVFGEISEDEADPSLWWVIISTGSIIIMTLSYVGWRKFLGATKTEKKRKDHND